MKLKNGLLATIFFLFSSSYVNSQNNNIPRYSIQDSSIYTQSNIYQQDLLYYYSLLLDAHPFFTKTTDIDIFEHKKDELYKTLANCTSTNEFSIYLQQLASMLNDAHTRIMLDFNGSEKYPVEFKWVNDTMYIIGLSRDISRDFVGSAVKSINHIQTAQLMDMIKPFSSSENLIQTRLASEYFLNSISLLNICGISKGNDALHIETITGNRFEISKKNNTKMVFLRKDVIQSNSIPYYNYEIDKKNQYCHLMYNSCSDKLDTDAQISKIAWYKKTVVKIGLFFGFISKSYNQYFHDFLNKMVYDINKNKIKRLVVDLRINGGGNSSYCVNLLYAIGVDSLIKDYSSGIKMSQLLKNVRPKDYDEIDKKIISKNGITENRLYMWSEFQESKKGASKLDYSSIIKHRFKGEVIFLIGNRTFSSATMLAAWVKDNKLFTVAGEPSAQLPCSFGDILSFQLPNTKTRGIVSCKYWLRPDTSKCSEPYLIPDVLVPIGFDNFKNGKDTILDWAINQFKN
jgi:hypothetical protein